VRKIYSNSKINLSYGSYSDIPNSKRCWGFSDRCFNVSLCKGFNIHDSRKLLNKSYTNREIITFKNIDDCAKKINYYLKNFKKRKAIALNGYKRTINGHTSKYRAGELINNLKLKKIINYGNYKFQ
jgi:spore maturation protein CgeB